MQAPIILLKEGTENLQGKSQLVSNINACQAVAEAVRTTLGPRGMDKLIVDDNGKATISNDGATIMKELDIVHPAAKTLVDIAKSQDAEVGDGTTTVVLLAAEFLKQCKPFVDEGVHPQIIIKSFRQALQMSVDMINRIAVNVRKDNIEERRALLEKCAMTTLSSKLIANQKQFFAKMVVDAVMQLDELLPLNMIGIKKVQGGALEDSQLITGVAFKKTFSYAGFEMQPKKYIKPKIALLNIELELKAEKENAEVRVDSVQEYQNIVDAEWNILYEKLRKIHETGTKVVLSKLPIGDVATQYFADRDMFCAGRVPEEDLKRTMKACGGSVLSTVFDINDSNLGTCELFEEMQTGGERYNIFTGCPNAKTVTIILRGGAEQFIEETERSLHDAIMIVRRAMKNDAVVAGGGAIEMELSKYLRDYSRTVAGKQQLLIGAMAKALEVIPRQLCDNAGFDATNILNKLRQKHATVLNVATKENIEVQKISQMEKGKLNPYCQICSNSGWNCNYGPYCCRFCIGFFVSSVRNRAVYECINKNGQCFSLGYINKECDYCRLNEQYRLKMKAHQVGMQEDSNCYFNGATMNLRKAAPIEPPDDLAKEELQSLKTYYRSAKAKFKAWMEVYPPSLKLERPFKFYFKKYALRGVIMEIVEDCLNIHDVFHMKTEYRYYDPYRCTIPSFQYFNIQILELVRMFKIYYNKDYIEHEIKNTMIYFKDFRKADDAIIQKLQYQMTKIVNWLKESVEVNQNLYFIKEFN